MNRKVTVNCPYCGHGNVSNVSDEFGGKQIVTCNMEDGGCDRAFVAVICVSITAKAFKIEGQEAAQAGDGPQRTSSASSERIICDRTARSRHEHPENE